MIRFGWIVLTGPIVPGATDGPCALTLNYLKALSGLGWTRLETPTTVGYSSAQAAVDAADEALGGRVVLEATPIGYRITQVNT